MLLSGTVPQITIIVTETPYEILERVARSYAKLIYDGTDGNLIIASVGDGQMASAPNSMAKIDLPNLKLQRSG